jgi:hypothetical protein
MTRPAVEVADILRAQGQGFLDRYRASLDFQQLKAFRAIQRCRTVALGGHRDTCQSCGYQAISYNSCRNRHCPKCQTQARERWLAARERELLATSYFHVVFTVPHELNLLALENPRLLYDLLFAASAQTLLEIAADPKHLGAEIGIISTLHTWGQNLLLHPHIHCVIPAGGLSLDHRRWLRPRYPFFLPVKVLSRVFRGKFLAGTGSQNTTGALRKFFSLALSALRRIDDRDAKIYGCGTISMHLLRFFLTQPSAATEGCAPARRCIRVSTASPQPGLQTSAASTCPWTDARERTLTLPQWSATSHPNTSLAFKPHSSPRPPQTPAASS